MIRITLPDGTQREYDEALSVYEVAASIGVGLAKTSVAGRVDGVLVGCEHLLEQDARLQIITTQDPEGLEILRRSCASLLAMATQQLFPIAQLTAGSPIDDGFSTTWPTNAPSHRSTLNRSKHACATWRTPIIRCGAWAILKPYVTVFMCPAPV